MVISDFNIICDEKDGGVLSADNSDLFWIKIDRNDLYRWRMVRFAKGTWYQLWAKGHLEDTYQYDDEFFDMVDDDLESGKPGSYHIAVLPKHKESILETIEYFLSRSQSGKIVIRISLDREGYRGERISYSEFKRRFLNNELLFDVTYKVKQDD